MNIYRFFLKMLMLAVSLAYALPSIAATIYKCTGPQGTVHYSDHRLFGCHSPMSLLHLGHSTFSPHRETTPPHDLSLRSRKAELQNNRHLLATWEEALDHLEATPVPHNTTERAKRTEGIHILKAEIRRAQHRINTLTAPTSHIQ